ncbi:hypothetical protein [Pelagibacterium mangrovi]|uniref:hypothetical protein n=1 Tax=Pelagibacterium mangrovi TaxID=3119828 RepID=UPI002FC8CAB3
MRFTDKFTVKRARIAWTGKRADALVLLLGKAAALFLLFVLPAHGVMQQIVCEHLPTSYDQAADEIKLGKVLRTGPEKSACALRADVDGDDGSPVIDVAAGVELNSGPQIDMAFVARSDRPLVAPFTIWHFQRAPPAA